MSIPGSTGAKASWGSAPKNETPKSPPQRQDTGIPCPWPVSARGDEVLMDETAPYRGILSATRFRMRRNLCPAAFTAVVPCGEGRSCACWSPAHDLLPLFAPHDSGRPNRARFLMHRFESFSIGAGWCQALSDYSVDPMWDVHSQGARFSSGSALRPSHDGIRRMRRTNLPRRPCRKIYGRHKDSKRTRLIHRPCGDMAPPVGGIHVSPVVLRHKCARLVPE